MRVKASLALLVVLVAAVVSSGGAVASPSCITGTVVKITVKNGQNVCTSGAAIGSIVVQQGGSVDVEGGSFGSLSANGAVSVTVNGVSGSGNVTVTNSSGPVYVIHSTVGAVKLSDNNYGSIVSDTHATSVKATEIIGGTIVTNNIVDLDVTVTKSTQGIDCRYNTIGGDLTVTTNYGGVVDTPNTVGGTSNIQ